jgi:hypothetical protein
MPFGKYKYCVCQYQNCRDHIHHISPWLAIIDTPIIHDTLAVIANKVT